MFGEGNVQRNRLNVTMTAVPDEDNAQEDQGREAASESVAEGIENGPMSIQQTPLEATFPQATDERPRGVHGSERREIG